MINLVVMISGSGTNLQALIDAIDAGHLNATIDLVVSNRQNAYGLTRAKEAGIETLYFPLKPYKENGKSRETYDADLAAKIKARAPDLIVLAGWMHILSPAFLDAFPRKVINLHPALPGQFPGIDAIERAYNAAQSGEISHSGVMIHYAIPEVDAGNVIIKAEVPILESDTLEDFAERIHATEHQLIVKAVALFAQTDTPEQL
jgi:formyltetrahydrofolate-dependent phosphoribosylglycinamide formyltransferase